MSRGRFFLLLAVVAAVAVLSAVYVTSQLEDPSEPRPATQLTPTRAATFEKISTPTTQRYKGSTQASTRPSALTASVKSSAISSIMGYPEVMDAAITQRGDQLSLVLIVFSGTSSQRAKALGDNFVRVVKSLSPDASPGRDIGKGIYDYVIGVYYPNEKSVAQGAKSRTSSRISW